MEGLHAKVHRQKGILQYANYSVDFIQAAMPIVMELLITTAFVYNLCPSLHQPRTPNYSVDFSQVALSIVIGTADKCHIFVHFMSQSTPVQNYIWLGPLAMGHTQRRYSSWRNCLALQTDFEIPGFLGILKSCQIAGKVAFDPLTLLRHRPPARWGSQPCRFSRFDPWQECIKY